MRVLVAIANYGTKNDHYLAQLLESYAAMSFDVDVVVMSNLAKDLGPGVEVRVGTPTADPRSLPFAHRELFAERRDDYDLYLYTEDDTLIGEEHVAAFLEAAEVLPADTVAGFMRYETHSSGERSYCTIHSAYYWDPATVQEHGGELFARFSNAHSACFMLTPGQLATAIDSGGFLVPPHAGRYAMLEAAATDPYIQCGLQKVICFSRLDSFLLPHLPNIYLGRLGIAAAELQPQLDALAGVLEGKTPTGRLFRSEGLDDDPTWDKCYYEAVDASILEQIPDSCQTVLSLGAGSGALEVALAESGRAVAAIPIDAVIGALALSQGVEVFAPDLEGAFADLGDRTFDCILLANALQYFPDPGRVLELARGHLSASGSVLVSARNPAYFHLRSRLSRHRVHQVDARFPYPTVRRLRGWLTGAGFEARTTRRLLGARMQSWSRASLGLLDRWISANTILLAHPSR